eukprot:1157414-Pyramimonas_sp.AAC.2
MRRTCPAEKNLSETSSAHPVGRPATPTLRPHWKRKKRPRRSCAQGTSVEICVPEMPTIPQLRNCLDTSCHRPDCLSDRGFHEQQRIFMAARV